MAAKTMQVSMNSRIPLSGSCQSATFANCDNERWRDSVNSSVGGLPCPTGVCDSSELTEFGNPNRLWTEECHNILAQNGGKGKKCKKRPSLVIAGDGKSAVPAARPCSPWDRPQRDAERPRPRSPCAGLPARAGQGEGCGARATTWERTRRACWVSRTRSAATSAARRSSCRRAERKFWQSKLIFLVLVGAKSQHLQRDVLKGAQQFAAIFQRQRTVGAGQLDQDFGTLPFALGAHLRVDRDLVAQAEVSGGEHVVQ